MNDEGDDDETLPLNGHALHFAGDGGGVYGGGRTREIIKESKIHFTNYESILTR